MHIRQEIKEMKFVRSIAHVFGRQFVMLILGMLIVVSIASAAYIQSLRTMTQTESFTYLSEITYQIKVNIERTLSENNARLDVAYDALRQGHYETIADFQSAMNRLNLSLKYSQFGCLDANGNWCFDGVPKQFAPLMNFNIELTQQRNAIMSPTYEINGADHVLFALHIAPITVGDTQIIALAGAVRRADVANMLSLSLFGENGYASIIRTDGAIVARTVHRFGERSVYNVLNALSAADLPRDITLTQLREKIELDLPIQLQLQVENQKMFVTFLPLNVPQSWTLMTMVPPDVVSTQATSFMRLTLASCVAVILIFSTLLGIIIIMQRAVRIRLETAAYVDDVTGGANRSSFVRSATLCLQSTSIRPRAVIYCNIDRFKMLNERLGRGKADILLAHVYRVLAGELSGDEYVGRLMADHFGLLLTLTSRTLIIERITRWNELIIDRWPEALPFANLLMTYGIYETTEVYEDILLMLDRANLACKRIDDAVKMRVPYYFYDADLQEKLAFSQMLEGNMQAALENKAFIMYLQPKYEPRSEKIVGAEALVRWQLTTDKMIFPDSFIPLFESNGFIIALDLYIFECACAFLRCLQDDGRPTITISINLSRAHLLNPDFIHRYVEIWSRYNIPASAIELELTETTIFDDFQLLRKIIGDIHACGFRCSMDDFGSGYSSLNMLHQVDVDTLKLDKCFFQDLSDEYQGKNKIVIKNVLNLAQELKMTVVAEGIETRGQMEFVRDLGCDMIQGYYYARPMPQEKVYALLCENSEDK